LKKKNVKKINITIFKSNEFKKETNKKVIKHLKKLKKIFENYKEIVYNEKI